MSATQPGSPPDTDDDAESRGLGPVVNQEKEAEEEWRPLRDHPGFEVNLKGEWRTVAAAGPPDQFAV